MGSVEKAEWHNLIGEPQYIDCFELLAQLPDSSIDLLFLDPPYNIGVFCKMPPDEYLAWCERWIKEGSRVLAANGAFWVSHKNPLILGKLSEMIAARGRERINWITWDKYNDTPSGEQFIMNRTKLHPQGKRSFDQDAEYLIYHTDEGNWTAQCDKERGFIFESLRAYLAGEWKKAKLNFEDARQAVRCAAGSGLPSHWFTRSQWALPTKRKYYQLRAYANSHNHGGEYLRREYEDLRYTFNNPGKVSSVWQIPPASSNGHPTPKPEKLLERIIETTSNPGDLVLDFFAGSFTTAVVAERLERKWICCDHNAEYVELGRARLEKSKVYQKELL